MFKAKFRKLIRTITVFTFVVHSSILAWKATLPDVVDRSL